jgi:very-short-patch-repair endonuclease
MGLSSSAAASAVVAVAGFDGIATRAQLIDVGVTGPAMSVAVRKGELRRVRRAHYALPDADSAAIAAVRVGGRLGCASAAESHGLWTRKAGVVHVALAANAARLRTNRVLVRTTEPITPDRLPHELRLHWNDVAFGSREDQELAWRVPVERALAQLATCSERRDIAAAFESAVASGVITLPAAQRLLDASAPDRLGGIRLRGHDGSGVETYLALELIELGVPFVQQVPFSGVGRVDFLVGGRLVVEVDGYAHHSDREAFSRDRRRDAELLGIGIPTLRLAAADVLADPRAAALRVVQAFGSLS